MSDDIDDFLAGLDSLTSASILTQQTSFTQPEVVLTSDNLGGTGRTSSSREAGKKRGRPSGSLDGSPLSPTPPSSSQFPSAAASRPSAAASSSGEWACSACTYANGASTIACDMCGTKRPEGSAASQHWACPVCTFSNGGANTACEACGCDRSVATGGGSVVVCGGCGYVNKKAAVRCRRCKASTQNARDAAAAAPTAAVVPTTIEEDDLLLGSPSASAAVVTPTAAAAPSQQADGGDGGGDQQIDEFEEGSESSESDYGSDAGSDEAEGADGAQQLTTHQVSSFLQAIPSVNTEHIAPAPVPRSMAHCGLKDFQLQAVAWMADRERLSLSHLGPFSMTCKGGLLADYMGLGKTRTIIGLCESTKAIRRDRFVSDRVDSAATLIVCPVSVMSQWRDEIKRTVRPAPRVLIYYGQQRKQSIFQVAQEYDYVISSYHSLAYEYNHCPAKKIFRIFWHRIVLDEAHWIRNRTTNIARATNTLNATRRWVVTATPIQNRLTDLEPLIAFLRLPGFSEHVWWRNDMDEQMIKCLQAILSTIMLRRTPATTINGVKILDLPEKEMITIEDKLPEEEQQFLKDLKNRVNHRLNMAHAMNDNIRTYAHAFEMLVRCRQACLHRNIVIQSLRAKLGMQGTREGAAAELSEHQQRYQDGKRRAEDAAIAAELEAQEAKQREAMAAADQLEGFLKVLKKKLLDFESNFIKGVVASISDKSAFEGECVVCLDTMKQPALLPCGHMFCHECISTCLEAMNKCPHCKVKAGPSKLIAIPAAVHGLAGGAAEDHSPSKSKKKKEDDDDEEDEAEIDERAFNRWLSVDPGTLSEWAESDRTRQIRELITATDSEERVLVLSSFVTYLRSLEVHLGRHGITTCFMEGSMNPSARQSVVSKFVQPTGGPKVLLASIGTCGVGLNLTRASLCILAEPTWNPGVEEQAINRIHRLGQTRNVKIVRFAAKDTIENAMMELCEAKRKLGERLTNSRMTRDDIIAILHRFSTAGTPPAAGAPSPR